MPGGISRFYCWVGSVTFVLALATPLALHSFCSESIVASVELRTPAVLPGRPKTMGTFNRWPRSFDAYLNDHFGGRNWLIRLNSRVRWMLGESGSPEVLVGRSGWLFLARNGDVLERHRGVMRFSESELSSWMEVMGERAKWLNGRGIGFLIGIIPEKSTIYSEYLPQGLEPIGSSPTEQIIGALQKQNLIPWLDLRPVLQRAALNEQLYDRFDTHWNDKGAYIAYREVMKTLAGRYPVHVVPEVDVRFERVVRSGDLARLLNLQGILRESTWSARLIHSAFLGNVQVPDSRTFKTVGWRTTSALPNGLRAVILCDSFVQSYMAKFLCESFSVAEFRHHDRMSFPVDLIEREQPELVVYLASERLIPFRLVAAEAPHGPVPLVAPKAR